MGVTSRRKADELIAAGRVAVDGVVVTRLGTKADPAKNEISVDGVPLDRPSRRRLYYLLYKPKGVVTTLSDPEGRRTVRDLIPGKDRIFPVGRLDWDADGVLLMTNDGDLANRLSHPRYGVKRTYEVKVKGKPSAETVARIRRGIRLEDGMARPDEVGFLRHSSEHSWFRITVTEGRNRLIKRIWLRAGHPVIKLTRTKFAGLVLGDLRPGEHRSLRPAEVTRLQTTLSRREESRN